MGKAVRTGGRKCRIAKTYVIRESVWKRHQGGLRYADINSMLTMLSVLSILVMGYWLLVEALGRTRSRVIAGLVAIASVGLAAFMWGRFTAGSPEEMFAAIKKSPTDPAGDIRGQ